MSQSLFNPPQLSSAGMVAFQSGGLHGDQRLVGDNVPTDPLYGLLGRRRPTERWCCVRLPRCGFWFFPWTPRLVTLAICRGWASPEGTSNATPFWSRGHASVGGACCWGPPDETGCLLSYRQLMSGCRRVRYPLTTDALSLSHDVRSLLPRKDSSAWRPLEEFGDSPACDQ